MVNGLKQQKKPDLNQVRLFLAVTGVQESDPVRSTAKKAVIKRTVSDEDRRCLIGAVP